MLEEYFLMKGYVNSDSLPDDMAKTEVLFATREINGDFPSEDDILDFIAQFNLDRVEVVKSYKAE